MNTLLCSIDIQKYIDIVFENYNSICDVVDSLRRHTNVRHEEYESVKLYGKSKTILSALRYIIKSNKYSDIVLASIDITLGDIDGTIRDEYVLSFSDNELYIETAWNGDKLFENESKYTICIDDVPDSIVINALKSDTTVEICHIANNNN